jgi:D-aminopeptidase
VVPLAGEPVTVGVLVQANFGGTLRVLGRTVAPEAVGAAPEAGSCVVVTATDAPLDARQLTRLARRAVFGLARVGAAYGHGSGDYGLAVGTRTEAGTAEDAALDPLFASVLDAVEEAVLNSLFTATTTSGPEGRTLHAVPLQKLRDLLGR